MIRMENLIADLRHAWRVFWKSPGFSAIAIAALALGIGANTAIFSVINTVLLKPLPYTEPGRLMRLGRSYPDGMGDSISVAKYNAWKKNDAFEAMTAYDFAGPGMNIGGGDRPEQVKGIHASAEFFRVFGTAPAIGRTFTSQEDLPGGPKVAVLSYTLWKDRFGADPGLAGRSINIGGEPTTVIGMLPARFQSDPPADIFIPLQADPNSTNQGHYLRVAGRLKPRRHSGSRQSADEDRRRALPASQSQVDGQDGRRGGDPAAGSGGGRRPSNLADSAGRGRFCAAHRMRERSQSTARARLNAPERDGHPHSHRRQPEAHRAPIADRERGAGNGGRAVRLRPGRVGCAVAARHCARQYPARQR